MPFKIQRLDNARILLAKTDEFTVDKNGVPHTYWNMHWGHGTGENSNALLYETEHAAQADVNKLFQVGGLECRVIPD